MHSVTKARRACGSRVHARPPKNASKGTRQDLVRDGLPPLRWTVAHHARRRGSRDASRSPRCRREHEHARRHRPRPPHLRGRGDAEGKRSRASTARALCNAASALSEGRAGRAQPERLPPGARERRCRPQLSARFSPGHGAERTGGRLPPAGPRRTSGARSPCADRA